MRKLTRVFDRTVVVLLATAMLVTGAAGLLWCTRIGPIPEPDFVGGWPDALSTGPLRELATASWWPWTMLTLGVAAVLVGLRWLVAHLPRRRVGFLRVGDDDGGRLLVDARSVVDAAALAFNNEPGVDTAVGSLDLVDGRLIARVALTMESDADLADLARRADLLSGQLRAVTGRDDLRMSFLLRTTPQTAARVE